MLLKSLIVGQNNCLQYHHLPHTPHPHLPPRHRYRLPCQNKDPLRHYQNQNYHYYYDCYYKSPQGIDADQNRPDSGAQECYCYDDHLPHHSCGCYFAGCHGRLEAHAPCSQCPSLQSSFPL